MARKLPGELVAKTLLKVIIIWVINNFIIVLFEVAVILGDDCRHGRHGYSLSKGAIAKYGIKVLVVLGKF